MKVQKILLIIVIASISGCLFNDPTDLTTSDYIKISEAKQMVTVDDTLDVYVEPGDTTGSAKDARDTVDYGYIMHYVARILPVTVNTMLVQANDVVIHGSIAIIAYNYAGDIFAGAIQIVDITKKGKPRILEELTFTSLDINAVYTDGNSIVFGGAADPDIWPGKSFVGSFPLLNPVPAQIEEALVFLPSHAVTGITKSGDSCYVGTGAADGALVILNTNLTPIDTVLYDDIRDVDAYTNGICMITGTTDSDEPQAYVHLLNNSGVVTAQLPITNFGSDYHKATIEVYGGSKALLGLSAAGCMILDLPTNQTIFTQENPSVGDTLLGNTNSVSSDANLLFTANGNFGFRVFKIKGSDFSKTEHVGYYPFEGLTENGENYSANHVEYKANHLFVAAGVGGVVVCALTER